MFRLTMFLLLTVVALPSWGENPPVFDDKWGSFCSTLTSGPCIGLFNEPYDIAIAPNGDIYVSDTINQRIQKFDSNGNFILQWGSFCNISNGTGCIDPDGGGPLQIGDGQFFDPVGLTVDIDGNVYVAEYSNHRMQKFDSNGNFLMKIGTQGIGTGLINPGQFTIADDVVVDSSKNIYIADKMNHRIQKFSQTGTFLHAWGTPGLAAGQFMNPVGLAIDMSDNIFVSDWNGHRIQKFDAAGTHLTMWGANGADGTMGTGPGEFNQPVHLGIDFFGNVYVPDSNNHRIQKFDGNGTFLSEWGGLCDIGVGGCIDPDNLGPLQPGDGYFFSPEGVAVNRFVNDPMAAIYVADTFNSRVQKFLPDPGGAADCDCATNPPADTAAFKVGVAREVLGMPDEIDVPLIVHTSEAITFSQMRVEYDSTCVTFVSATVGTGVNGFGVPVVDDDINAVTAGLNRHVQLNVTGTYTGCDVEVFVLRFKFPVGSTPPCDIDWDPTLGGPNSNNHLNYDNTGGGDGKILPDEITFCKGQVEPLPCPNCVTPGPPADTAVFKVGTPVFLSANQVEVPLLVDTREDATFTQMRLEFDSTCLSYVSTTVGVDVANPGGLFAFDAGGANNPGVDQHVQINVSGDYTGCDQQVFRLTFDFQPGHTPPCVLLWDQTLGGPNSNSHLNYSVGAGGTDGKILPTEITFCDGSIAGPVCDSDVSISGTVEYYSNNQPILGGIPDSPGSPAVTVEDCPQTQTTTAMPLDGSYSLSFGPGPVNVDLCASRLMAVCGTDEDGVISGDDIIMLQDTLAVSPLGFANPKQQLAANVNKDALVTLTDVLLAKRWIARKVCDGTDVCGGFNNNCAATWRFLFFTNPNDPDDFEVDMGSLTGVCEDDTVRIEGVFLGDVDGSWPSVFPKAAVAIPLAFEVKGWQQDVVEVALSAALQPGQSLRHVIYSLDYDATSFEYLGMRVGSGAPSWESLDNPDVPGTGHGIAHMPAQSPGVTQSGEVVVFRFRARGPDVATSLAFSRLRTNDVDVLVPEIELRHGEGTVARTLPTRYTMSVGPNPFNPSTNIKFTIPAGNEASSVQLRIYDISGRLVRTLLHEPKGPGFHQVLWNGTDNDGTSVGAGVYVARIHVGKWSAVQKLALVK